jgi:hypothetical protein
VFFDVMTEPILTGGDILYQQNLKLLREQQEYLQRNIALINDKEELTKLNIQLQNKNEELENIIEQQKQELISFRIKKNKIFSLKLFFYLLLNIFLFYFFTLLNNHELKCFLL